MWAFHACLKSPPHHTHICIFLVRETSLKKKGKNFMTLSRDLCLRSVWRWYFGNSYNYVIQQKMFKQNKTIQVLLFVLQEFSIQQYIPLDSSIQFHKIVACTALFFSLLHTAGHMVNFYHVSTQPIENLRCLTKEVHFTSDFRPGITYWVFQTVTGNFWLL